MRLLISALAFALTTNAFAAPMAGLAGNSIVTFDSNSPATLRSTQLISGLPAGETVLAIASRPATLVLYGLTSAGRVVTIEPSTGSVSILSTAPTALGSTDIGIGFNPVVDRIRVVTAALGNSRFNPNDGAFVATDTALTGVTAPVSVAYDRSTNPAPTLTTMFVIDAGTDSLTRQGGVDGTPSPNGGVNTVIGPLGFDTNNEVGFDISSASEAVASLTVAGAPGLYTINLTTGAATLRANFPASAAVTDVAFIAGFPLGAPLPTLSMMGMMGLLFAMTVVGTLASRKR